MHSPPEFTPCIQREFTNEQTLKTAMLAANAGAFRVDFQEQTISFDNVFLLLLPPPHLDMYLSPSSAHATL